MNKLFFFIAILFLSTIHAQAQEAINNYKYIIVQNQYDFQKSEDQYQLNSLAKFLFNKYGYNAYLDSEDFPGDLRSDNCLGLKAMIKDVKGGFLKTKIQIDLVDCKNNIVATSQIGTNKIKDFKKAYTQALRDAFITYQYFDYQYNGNAGKVDTTSTENTVSEDSSSDSTGVEINFDEQMVEVEEVPESKDVSSNAKVEAVDNKDILYAQPIDNGYQIVDTEPKKVMVLLYSAAPNTFIVQGKDAIVFKKGNLWVYSENDGKTSKIEVINLKF